MSYKMTPLVNSKKMAVFRTFLSVIMTCTFFTATVCGPMAFRRLHPGADPTKWRKHDGGWELHITATICEWVSAMTLDVYILTYVREMHLISLSSPRVMFVIESLSLPTQESSWVGDYDQGAVRPPTVASAVHRGGGGGGGRNVTQYPSSVNDSFRSIESSSAIIG